MPHCILETTANVLDDPDLPELFGQLHKILMDTGEFELADIKSRALRHEHFCIGDGAPDRAFVTLTVQMLSGRSDAFKAELTRRLAACLIAAFPRSRAELRCSLTVQIVDIHRPSYQRHVFGPAPEA